MLVAFDVIGDDPIMMLTAPLASTRRILKKSGVALSAIDHFEVNEAFAVVPMAAANRPAEAGKPGNTDADNGAEILKTIWNEPIISLHRRKSAVIERKFRSCHGDTGFVLHDTAEGAAKSVFFKRDLGERHIEPCLWRIVLPIGIGKRLRDRFARKQAIPELFFADAGSGGEVIETTSDELRVLMRARRHLAPGTPDTFNVDTSATFQNMLSKVLNNFGAVVAAIAAVSLVVGGIVIMNIMLVSVTERTREIGVRKALGARRKDILLQFLIESGTMSLAGGLIGVIAGIAVAKLITLLISFPSEVAIWSILVGLFVATAVGLFFGVYPAYKAAELDPIAALRSEL